MNTPEGNTVSTAQLAMSLIYNVARKIPGSFVAAKSGRYDLARNFTGVELEGKTLGIIGCGRIGQLVANMATKMHMNVIGFDPVMPVSAFEKAGIPRASSIEEIWRQSDFITVHTPLNASTNKLINRDSLKKCTYTV